MKLLIKIILFCLLTLAKSYSQTAFFNVSKTTDCNILKVSMDASSSSGKMPITYYWDFGNGNTASGKDKSIVDAIYVQPGNPVVSLYIIDGNGIKSKTVENTLHILAGPKIDFDVSGTHTCLGQAIQFTNKTLPGSSKITGYVWNIGNNITLTDKDPNYTFNATGPYDVSLIVTDENGCNVNLKKTNLITVSTTFTAKFSADSAVGCNLPFTTKFQDRTDYSSLGGHKFTYNWNFGDGTYSSLQNPGKAYQNQGSYDVELSISDSVSKCFSKEKIARYINIDFTKPKVVSQFISKACSNYNYKISLNIQNIPTGFVKNIDFGDGTSYIIKDSESDIYHTYNKAGKYYLTTSYGNPQNQKCFKTGIDSITTPNSLEDFTADNVAGCKFPFTANFSVLNFADAVGYSWDFGDGTFSTASHPSKTYAQNGNYTVKLNVTGKSGCIYTFSKTDYIKIGPLQASFTSDAKRIETLPNEYDKHPIADPSVLYGGCVPFDVKFTNTSAMGNSIHYSWNFGDGNIISSSLTNLSHTYMNEGTFSPTLTATDDKGCQTIFTCKDCVKAGKPPVTTVALSGPDTVCCLYEKSFSANINPKAFDLLWYNIILNDGGPSPGITQAYYKNSAGIWVIEDHTETTLPYLPEGLGLNYKQSSFALPSGNQPDFYFYAYKNGCQTKIVKPKYQTHLLPWGTFSPLPCEEEEALQGGDTLDFNKVGGNWIIGKDNLGNPKKLSKAIVKMEFSSKTGCSMPVVTKTFTPADLGFDIETGAFEKIQKSGLFPKVKIPSCATKGDELLTTTYLYTDDDASKTYQNGKCLCEEHWPYKIGDRKKPIYTISQRKGCAPLAVSFKTAGSNADIQYLFENGLVLNGHDFSQTFANEGTYRFKTVSGTCASGKWTDSIIITKPKSQLTLNQSVFCLNSSPLNSENKSIIAVDHSQNPGNFIKKWKWEIAGKSFIKTDSSKVILLLDENDVSIIPGKNQFAKLTVTDQNNCSATDSIEVILRKTTSGLNVKRTIGCYDSLKIIPTDLKSGLYAPYKGMFTLYRHTGSGMDKILEKEINDVNLSSIQLDTNGTYKLSLKITEDALGSCISSHDTTLKVQYSSLLPGFKIKGKTNFSCVPSLVEAVDASVKFKGREIKSWLWKFTNQTTRQEVNGSGEIPAAFALTDSGYYSVNLTVVDESGCKKSTTKDSVIFINDLRGKISLIPVSLCPEEIGVFKGLSTNADKFYWDFGDGIVGSGLDILHSYKTPGEKNISFIVTDTSNCKRSYSGKLLVKKAPEFDLGKDTLLCERNSITYSAPYDSGYVYKWSSGESSQSLKVTNAGNYSLTIQDTLIKCNYHDTVKVTISKLPTVSIDTVPFVCKGENVYLKGHSNSVGKRAEWYKDNILIKAGFTNQVKADGNPVVLLKIYNEDNCSIDDSITLRILERPGLLLANKNVCPKDSILLKPEVTNKNPAFKWQWYFNSIPILGSNVETKMVKEPGTYSVSYGKTNCMVKSDAILKFHPLPDVTTNPEKVNFCEEFGSILLDGGKAFSHYWFSNGETQKDISISKPGTYLVKLGTEFNCYSLDSVIVETRCAPLVYVPNAFTPEIEGENKIHKIFGYNIGSFSLTIFNRWGEIIYESQDLKEPWNGYYRNELMPSGVYPWIIQYSGNNPDHTEKKQLQGKVVLER